MTDQEYDLIKAAEMALEVFDGPVLKDVTEHAMRLRKACDTLRQALSQPKREWVGLTVEDIDDLWKTEYFNVHYELPKAIEAKLKEKNT